MNEKTARLIVEALQSEGIDADTYKNYSGRGMYGTTTTAVNIKDNYTNRATVQRAVDNQSELFGEEGEEVPRIDDHRTDSLGLGWLIY